MKGISYVAYVPGVVEREDTAGDAEGESALLLFVGTGSACRMCDAAEVSLLNAEEMDALEGGRMKREGVCASEICEKGVEGVAGAHGVCACSAGVSAAGCSAGGHRGVSVCVCGVCGVCIRVCAPTTSCIPEGIGAWRVGGGSVFFGGTWNSRGIIASCANGRRKVDGKNGKCGGRSAP